MTALSAGAAAKRGAGYKGAVVGGFGLAAVLVGLIFWKLEDGGALAAAKWRPFRVWINWRFLLQGYATNLRIGAIAGVLALAAGVLLGLGRLARPRWIRWPVTAWVEAFRALPLIFLIFMASLLLPRYLHWRASAASYGIVALVLYNSAVLGEIVRAGVLSLDRGQTEAAQSIGLSYVQMMRLVLLPQALRRMVPALVSQLIVLLKDTSLLYLIAVLELTRKARALQAGNNNPLQTYFVVGLIFLSVNIVLSRLATRLEVRQRRRYGSAPITVGGVEELTALEAGAKAKEVKRG